MKCLRMSTLFPSEEHLACRSLRTGFAVWGPVWALRYHACSAAEVTSLDVTDQSSWVSGSLQSHPSADFLIQKIVGRGRVILAELKGPLHVIPLVGK